MGNCKLLSFLFVSVLSILANTGIYAAQTVGLFLNTSASYNGYTLFAPMGSTKTYLINNCGEKVHTWASIYRPGLSVYLLENGTLLRTANVNNTTFSPTGGVGGKIEMIDWNSNVIWSYTISSNTECQHHDIKYLPNGNILVVVWDSKTKAEAQLAGRTTSGTTLWSEKIMEIKPDLVNGGGTVVWEWKAWDHLVQDIDSEANNFGSVSSSPQLININHYLNNPNVSDWMHVNSVDYNAKLDQIVISNHNFNEIWVIDHSTTTAEAASHSGGKQNKGGDLLYRWGNPLAYKQGSSIDRMLFLQHNANWIDDSYLDGGSIMVFNNQAGSNYSTVNSIETPVNTDGSYIFNGTTYAPSNFKWSYMATTPTDFYSNNISGAQRLPNGNTLICSGSKGQFFEVDHDGNIVWKYVSPVSVSGFIAQGVTAANNLVFRAERYAPDFAGFTGKDLTSQGLIETGSTYSCSVYTDINVVLKKENNISLRINLSENELTVSSPLEIKTASIYNAMGQLIYLENPESNSFSISISKLNSGVYILNTLSTSNTRIAQKFTIQK